MRSDNRKARRQPLTCSSIAITANGVREQCRFADISETGARLKVEDSSKLPDQFILVLSERGKVMRRCDVIWRSAKQIGVRFRAS